MLNRARAFPRREGQFIQSSLAEQPIRSYQLDFLTWLNYSVSSIYKMNNFDGAGSSPIPYAEFGSTFTPSYCLRKFSKSRAIYMCKDLNKLLWVLSPRDQLLATIFLSQTRDMRQALAFYFIVTWYILNCDELVLSLTHLFFQLSNLE